MRIAMNDAKVDWSFGTIKRREVYQRKKSASDRFGTILITHYSEVIGKKSKLGVRREP